MREALSLRTPLLASAAALVLAACSFDSSALDDRPPCETPDDCPGVAECIAGTCTYTTDNDDVATTDTGDTGTDVGIDTDDDVGVDTLPDGGECAPGTAECIGQIARFCDANGQISSEIDCTAAATCPGSALGCACTAGACIPRVCAAGTRSCDDDNAVLCSPDGLSSQTVERCAETDRVCLGGVCTETECTGAETTCVGTSVIGCQDGTPIEVLDCLELGQRCVATGGTADCAPRLCDPGVAYCSDARDELLFCNDDGSGWSRTESCGTTAYCSTSSGTAVCVPAVCSPGGVRCSLSTEAVETCNSVGDAWLAGVSCGADEFCTAGACIDQVCEPSTAVCADLDTRVVCDARGASSAPSNCSVDRYCLGGECRTDVCVAGDLRCVDTRARELCDDFGSAWQSATACADTATCVEGECVPRVCTPSSRVCDENAVLTCNPSGTATTSTPCGAGQYCEGGECRTQSCAPGTLVCGDANDVRRCDTLGANTTFVETCPYGCGGGVCLAARCGDGVTSPERGESCDDANATFCDGCESCTRRGAIAIGPTTATTTTRNYNLASNDFTVEAWVNVSGSDGVFAGATAPPGGATDFASIGVSGGAPYFEFGLGTGSTPVRAQGPAVIRGTGWHHVAGVRFARHWAVLFVDGALVAFSHPTPAFSSCDTDRIFIGSSPGLPFVGVDALIDEVRFMSRREYVREFKPLRRIEAIDAATIALFGFDDGNAESADDRGTLGNDLTLQNATWLADACFGASTSSIACGDGAISPWESCDDGDFEGGDGCSPSCLRESTCSGAGRTIGARGECYLYSTTATSWTAARDACVAAGASLVTIDDEYEQSFIRSFVATGTAMAWIGLNDRTTEGAYTWISGATSAFRFWNVGEPNNTGGNGGNPGEDCIQLFNTDTGAWNDIGCDTALGYICESRAY